MANAREIKQDQQCPRHNEDYQCHVYDFFFQMKKAKKILSDTEPYFYTMQAEIAESFVICRICSIRYFNGVMRFRQKRKIGSIVITADKGYGRSLQP